MSPLSYLPSLRCPALVPTGCWVGPGLGDNELQGEPQWLPPVPVSMQQKKLLKVAATSVYVPRVSHSCPPPLLWETLQDQEVRLA